MRGRPQEPNYQPVVGANLAQGVLSYTPAQVGAAFDTSAGTITESSADYAPMPETSPMSGVNGRANMSTRLRSRTGRTPFTYTPLLDPIVTDDGGSAGPTGGRDQGAVNAPTRASYDLDVHGPWDSNYAFGRIDLGPDVKKPSWFSKWFGNYFKPSKDGKVVKALGRPSTNDNEQESTFTTDHNSFVVPDLRVTFNTPAVAGVATDAAGKAYVAKAGRPIQDPQFDPFAVKLTNERLRVVEDSPPFLPDRTMAGAADPTQARPATAPHWWFVRPFDQQEAQHLSGMKGVVRKDPTAARPIATSLEMQSDIAAVHTGQRSNMVQTPAPGMSPSGPQPNTLRQSPQPWDSDLYAVQDPPMLRRNFRGRS